MQNLFKSPGVSQVSIPAVAQHTFYIHGTIEDIYEYNNMIAVLDNCQENDIINMFINTPGGSLTATISILHAMMRCRGTVVTHADGEVASAGTLLFLAGTHKVVYPYAHFMFHDGSMGNIGKINESLKNISATSELLEKMAYDIYKPFFSEEEIDDILEGRDYYCSSEEMYDRIEEGLRILSEEPEDEVETDALKESEMGEGDVVEVDNPDLKTHGKQGWIVDFQVDKVKVEFEDGTYGRYKSSNLKLV